MNFLRKVAERMGVPVSELLGLTKQTEGRRKSEKGRDIFLACALRINDSFGIRRFASKFVWNFYGLDFGKS